MGVKSWWSKLNKKSLLLVVLVIVVGVEIGWYGHKAEKKKVALKRNALDDEKRSLIQAPVRDDFTVPILKRIKGDQSEVYYNLHGAFVSLKPMSETGQGMWEGVLQLWGGKPKVKILMGIVAANKGMMIAFAQYEGSWFGSSVQRFVEADKVFNASIKPGDEVVVRVKINLRTDKLSPKQMMENLKMARKLEEIKDNWSEVKDKDEVLPDLYYAERVGLVL